MATEFRVIVLPEAQKDLREIAWYIATELESPQAAINTMDCIEDAINTLRILPERNKPIDDRPWGGKGVRKIQAKNFYVYYVVSEDLVKVMSVIYVRRDQKRILDQW